MITPQWCQTDAITNFNNSVAMNGRQDNSTSNVKAIGLNKSHGSSLCLLDEVGQPIFGASEERFTRIKLQRGMPHKTFDYVAHKYNLDQAKIAIGRLDTLRRIAREMEYYVAGNQKGFFTNPVSDRALEFAQVWYRKKIRKDRQYHRFSIDTRYFTGRSLDYGFEHHLCHMASAYYC
ncbi:MAG: carbamoyltransferase N-terminal domain-containing protein, partial [Nitrososphaera sp.]